MKIKWVLYDPAVCTLLFLANATILIIAEVQPCSLCRAAMWQLWSVRSMMKKLFLKRNLRATATTSITSQAYGTISSSFLTLSFPTEPFYNKTMNTAVPWAPVWQTNMAKDCKWGHCFSFFLALSLK